MIFSVIVYLLGVLASCHSMESDPTRDDGGTRGMTPGERMDKGTKIAQVELARLSRFACDAELRSALKRYPAGPSNRAYSRYPPGLAGWFSSYV